MRQSIKILFSGDSQPPQEGFLRPVSSLDSDDLIIIKSSESEVETGLACLVHW